MRRLSSAIMRFAFGPGSSVLILGRAELAPAERAITSVAIGFSSRERHVVSARYVRGLLATSSPMGEAERISRRQTGWDARWTAAPPNSGEDLRDISASTLQRRER